MGFVIFIYVCVCKCQFVCVCVLFCVRAHIFLPIDLSLKYRKQSVFSTSNSVDDLSVDEGRRLSVGGRVVPRGEDLLLVVDPPWRGFLRETLIHPQHLLAFGYGVHHVIGPRAERRDLKGRRTIKTLGS